MPRGWAPGLGGLPSQDVGVQLPRQECVHFPALIGLIWAESSITRTPLHPACSPTRGRQAEAFPPAWELTEGEFL